MRKVEKKKLSKNQLTLIVLASLFILLLAAYFIVEAVAAGIGKENEPPTPPFYDASVGETIYLGNAVAYPPIENGQMLSVFVSGKDGDFMIKRWPDDSGSFRIWYDNDGDGEGEIAEYNPPIADKENSFNYESLYSVEGGDGIGMIYMLTYLCSALNYPTITERIELPKGEDKESLEKRNLLLKNYGFEQGKITGISFDYKERGADGTVGEKKNHTIVLGGRALNDSGFYYTVDGRDYVYYTKSNYFEYATLGVAAFVKGMLVSEGLSGDSTYEPYLTPDFKEWVNTQHKKDENALTGPLVEDGSTVIASGEIFELDPSAVNGYLKLPSKMRSFDLNALKEHPDFERIKASLVGREVGLNYSASPIVITLTVPESENRLINFASGDSVLYKYEISAIEAVLTDTEEISMTGAPVSNNSTVKITYTYSVDGEKKAGVYHGTVDLSESTEFASALGGLSVGELSESITVEVNYTKENSHSVSRKLYVSEILAIYDYLGNVADKVTETSYVKIRYVEEINGTKSESKIMYLALSEIKDDAETAAIKFAVLGKSTGTYEGDKAIVAYERTGYYEASSEYTVYSLNTVDYFVTSELVVAFRFKNASERDPYYGESFFENTLTNKYSLYGLNAATCEAVVRVLGGIGDNSSASVGLSGKTVAIGLTPEIMDKYGLYAYTVYFELPRGIYDASEGDEEDSSDTLSDYGWYSTLGFTLYISEEDPETGKRCVGSDMYDLVAEVDGKGLEFLNYGFSEFWARRNIVLLDITNVDKIRVEFDMTDVYGEYDFDLNMETVWGGELDGEQVISGSYQPGFTKLNKLYVNITQGEGSMASKLSEYFESTGNTSVSATELYNRILNGGNMLYEPGTIDSKGTANFKVAFELLQLMSYEGVLTEEEQKLAKSAPRVMRISLKLNQSALYYTYDFYRISDRKVMVKIFRSDENGNQLGADYVSEFYVSIFAFKKLTAGFVDFINARSVNLDSGYPD